MPFLAGHDYQLLLAPPPPELPPPNPPKPPPPPNPPLLQPPPPPPQPRPPPDSNIQNSKVLRGVNIISSKIMSPKIMAPAEICNVCGSSFVGARIGAFVSCTPASFAI